jgi:carboxypeptidase C (cathepsin A)
MTTNSRPEDKRYESRGKLKLSGKEFNYEATAAWLSLKDGDNRKADVFHTYYRQPRRAGGKRPLTFVFNGGPGAASAYLHVGTVGPKRVECGAEGSLPAAPARLVDNQESWLSFTDLVFVDPVGTGLSKTRARKKPPRTPFTGTRTRTWTHCANSLPPSSHARGAGLHPSLSPARATAATAARALCACCRRKPA